MTNPERYLRTILLAVGALIAFWALPQALELSSQPGSVVTAVEAGSLPQGVPASAPTPADPSGGPSTITLSAPNNSPAGVTDPPNLPVQGPVSLDGLSQQQLNQLLAAVLAALGTSGTSGRTGATGAVGPAGQNGATGAVGAAGPAGLAAAPSIAGIPHTVVTKVSSAQGAQAGTTVTAMAACPAGEVMTYRGSKADTSDANSFAKVALTDSFASAPNAWTAIATVLTGGLADRQSLDVTVIISCST